MGEDGTLLGGPPFQQNHAIINQPLYLQIVSYKGLRMNLHTTRSQIESRDPLAMILAWYRNHVASSDDPQNNLIKGLLLFRALVIPGVILRFIQNITYIDPFMPVGTGALKFVALSSSDFVLLTITGVVLLLYGAYFLRLIRTIAQKPGDYISLENLQFQFTADSTFAATFYILSRNIKSDLFFLFLVPLIVGWQIDEQTGKRRHAGLSSIWSSPRGLGLAGSVLVSYLVALLAVLTLFNGPLNLDMLGRALIKVFIPRASILIIVQVALLGAYTKSTVRDRDWSQGLQRLSQDLIEASQFEWLCSKMVELRKATQAQVCLLRVYYKGQPGRRVLVTPNTQKALMGPCFREEGIPFWFRGRSMRGSLWTCRFTSPAVENKEVAGYVERLHLRSHLGVCQEIVGIPILDQEGGLFLTIEIFNKASDSAIPSFSSDDKRAVENEGNCLGKAIAQAEFLRRCMTGVFEIKTGLGPYLILLEILKTAAKDIQLMFGVDSCGIVLLDKVSGFGRVVVRFPDKVGRFPSEILIPWADNPAIQKFKEDSAPIPIWDVKRDTSSLPENARKMLTNRGIKSILLAPIYLHNELIGTVGFDMQSRRTLFSEQMQIYAKAVSLQLAMIMANAFTSHAAAAEAAYVVRRRFFVTRLRESYLDMASQTSEEAILDQILRTMSEIPLHPDLVIFVPAASLAKADVLSIFMRGSIIHQAGWATAKESPTLMNLALWIRDKHEWFWPDRPANPRQFLGLSPESVRSIKIYLRSEEIRSAAGLPLVVQGREVGVLLFGFRTFQPFGIDEPDESFERSALQLVSDQAGYALAVLQLKREMNQSITKQEAETWYAEIHDVILQRVATVQGLLDITSGRLGRGDIEGVREKIGQIRGTLAPVIEEGRQLVQFRTHSPVATCGLRGAVQNLCRDYADKRDKTDGQNIPGINCELPDFDVELDQQVEHYLFRIVEEAVKNAVRHSRAKSINIRCEIDQVSIALVVEDDGQGFDPRQRSDHLGHGLSIMTSRAQRIGAQFSVDAKPGVGVRVTARVPFLRGHATQ